MKTLWEVFLKADFTPWKWRIYQKSTRKLLCADYGSLETEDETFDNMTVDKIVFKETKKGVKYWRVTVL